MLRMQHHQDGLLRRLSVIGVPRHTMKPFVAFMVKWEQCSGVEWTIKRLKSLKVDLIRSKTGLAPLTWVRKNRRGEIAGTIGSLFRWANKSDRNFSRCLQAFMAYSFYILPGINESQKKKFLSGINPEVESDGLSKSFHKLFARTVTRTLRKRSVTRCHRPLVTYRGSPDKKAPRLYGRKSVPQSKGILRDLEFFNTLGGINLYRDYKELYSPLLVGLKRRASYSLTPSLTESGLKRREEPIVCGEIHFLQEPGGKLRSVASPFRIHQEALRPFGSELYDVVRSLPWDCTFDQTKALPIIQSHLGKGGQVHSVDLSSATDHFPLSLQETALRALFQKKDWNHIDLFIKISRGKWKSPIGVLQWTKGQPLGLYPSFASFTLTHGLLLLHLAGGDYHQQFYVVGDDVVILEDELYHKYITMLDQMSCPWSEDKSLTSNKLAEFAGKVITSTMVIPQLKWRRMSNDNFLDICRLLGSRSRCLLSRRQKIVFDRVAHLCEPIGLNFSLPGDNLATMIGRTMDFYQPVKEVLGSLMGLRRIVNENVYESVHEETNSKEISDLVLTFDEKVKSVMSQTIFANYELTLRIGSDAFASLPEALELKPRLPLRTYTPKRRTMLDRYEGLLSKQKGLT